MPGPALPPLATNSVAPLQGLAGPRPDVKEPPATDTPAQGFATELQRRMDGEAKVENSSETKTATSTDGDDAAEPPADAQAATALPPELAALLAAAIPVGAGLATPPPPTPYDDATASVLVDETRVLDTGPRAAPRGHPTPLRDATPGELAPAQAATEPADSAASSKIVAASSDLPPVEGSVGRAAERGAEPLAPTNHFAAIHAAALANLRGEAPQPAITPVQFHVATPAGSPQWPEEVGNRVNWMVGHDESRAELTLTPPQLGRIEVSITVTGDQTSAQIVAATTAARDLIEESLPRLREILAQSGISLGQTDVGTSGQPGSPEDDRRGRAWNGSPGDAAGGIAGGSAAPWLRRVEGLVDTFA